VKYVLFVCTHNDGPVRSFLLALADRSMRECLQAETCYEAAS
jgi:hypothetical protein